MKIIFDSQEEYENYIRDHCPDHINKKVICGGVNTCAECWEFALEGKEGAEVEVKE